MGMSGRDKRRVRRAMLARDPHCIYCTEDLDETTATLEHIQPKGSGGRDIVSNLTLACAFCNIRRGCAPIELFVSLINEPEPINVEAMVYSKPRSPRKLRRALNLYSGAALVQQKRMAIQAA